MMSYWGEFARSGRPGRGKNGDLPEWTAFGPTKTQIMLAGSQQGGVRVDRSKDTEESLGAALFSDPMITPQTRCEILQYRVNLGWDFTAKDYDAVEACRPYPYHPWSEM